MNSLLTHGYSMEVFYVVSIVTHCFVVICSWRLMLIHLQLCSDIQRAMNTKVSQSFVLLSI